MTTTDRELQRQRLRAGAFVAALLHLVPDQRDSRSWDVRDWSGVLDSLNRQLAEGAGELSCAVALSPDQARALRAALGELPKLSALRER